jgi:hypothetical protein
MAVLSQEEVGMCLIALPLSVLLSRYTWLLCLLTGGCFFIACLVRRFLRQKLEKSEAELDRRQTMERQATRAKLHRQASEVNPDAHVMLERLQTEERLKEEEQVRETAQELETQRCKPNAARLMIFLPSPFLTLFRRAILRSR